MKPACLALAVLIASPALADEPSGAWRASWNDDGSMVLETDADAVGTGTATGTDPVLMRYSETCLYNPDYGREMTVSAGWAMALAFNEVVVPPGRRVIFRLKGRSLSINSLPQLQARFVEDFSLERIRERSLLSSPPSLLMDHNCSSSRYRFVYARDEFGNTYRSDIVPVTSAGRNP